MAKKRRSGQERKRRKRGDESPNNLIPTGVTILNCALADNPYGGYRKGTIVNVIGDSSAGKSILGHTTLAAVSHDPAFDEYELVYDDAEEGSDFDIKKLFGKKLLNRIQPPSYDEHGAPQNSDTIQDFHMHVLDRVDKGTPFIYILDSFDSLDSEEDEKKLEEQRAAWKKGKQAAGSYGTAKARVASAILKNIRSDIRQTNSLLIIISQVRDNLNAMAFGSKKTRSGGRALKHYSWFEIWLYLGKQIKSKDLMIGVNTMGKISKNRQTGKLREANFPIYYDYGIDDISANIDYLLDKGWLTKKKETIVIPEFDFSGSKQSLIKTVEKHNLERELQRMVGDCWKEEEEKRKLDWRKPKYE